MIFAKKPFESDYHVLSKAALYGLYIRSYPRLLVDVPVGDRYRPDLVQLDGRGVPQFWAILSGLLSGLRRQAAVELLGLPVDLRHFLAVDGALAVPFRQLRRQVWTAPA